MTDTAILVQNISKCYQIYDTPHDRLKQFVLPCLKRMMGKTPKQYFREFWALKDISFEVKKGETVGIIGRNGSGKSTLLQMICGTLSPTLGNIQTNGRIAALLELGSGFNPEFTGRENVYMNAALLGFKKEEVDERFVDITSFADIGDFIEQPVKIYSSGMVVRLAFAVQAMIEPDIFIVDEALAVGDEKFQRKCFARLEHLKKAGSAILFVSHSSSQITELCDSTLLLENGELLMYSSAINTVRTYRRLLYAPTEERKLLIQECRAGINSCIVLEDNIECGSLTVSNADFLDYFDPGLIPQSTVSYIKQGAEINSIQVLDNGGERTVNVLQSGMSYQFLLSGYFIEESLGVHFGIHICTVSGVCVTGQRYPEVGRSIDYIAAGKSFKAIFSFRIDLLPGVYFVGGGIWQESDCKHRLQDAFMFRVSEKKKQKSFGYVDSSVGETKFELI